MAALEGSATAGDRVWTHHNEFWSQLVTVKNWGQGGADPVREFAFSGLSL